MDEKLLTSVGLSVQQARAYRILILRKKIKPTEYAKISGESRTNSYHILDSLVDEELAVKIEENKKFVYYPVSPVALKSIVSKRIVREEQSLAELENSLPTLLNEFHKGGNTPKITIHRGKNELRDMYNQQMREPAHDLYFIRSKADKFYFGMEEMRKIRRLAKKHKKRRFGITPSESWINSEVSQKKDASTSLQRTWLSDGEYTAPVEWTVCGDTLQAIYFKHEGSGVSISHPQIAESFRQILKLLSDYAKASPNYKKSSH